jgi:hypothetical protein
MDQTRNQPNLNLRQEGESNGRRQAIRKLGKYAAYAAPFTLLVTNTKAQQIGTGHGGRQAATSARH